MERNRFVFLLVLIAIYGVSVGGSFALGRSAVGVEPVSTQMTPDVSSESSRMPVSNNDMASIREKIQSGEEITGYWSNFQVCFVEGGAIFKEGIKLGFCSSNIPVNGSLCSNDNNKLQC